MRNSACRYLQSIYKLKIKSDNLHAIDIAKYMNYSKASVSRAVKKLKKDEYIKVDKHGNINLTSKGYEKAKSIEDKYSFFYNKLIGMGLDSNTADSDASSFAYNISCTTFNKLKEFF